MGRCIAALVFATLLTAVALTLAPSWEGIATDPCLLACVAAAATIVLLWITAFQGARGIAVERIALAVFLAGMPVVYLLRWFRLGGGDPQWLAVETFGLVIYASLAALGLRRSPWFLAAGIAAHGLAWDSWHYGITNFMPSWYAITCLLVDVGIGLYVAARIPAWRAAAAHRPHP